MYVCRLGNGNCVERLLQKEQQQEKQHRLGKWKAKLRASNTQCYKWLKRGAPQVFKGLVSETVGVLELVTLVSEALLLIRRHWVRVSDREPTDFSNVWQHVQNDDEFDRQTTDTWPKLSSLECATAAVKLRGKASGMDGWSGDEVASIPPKHWQLFSDFIELVETSGKTPNNWRQLKQVHSPKPSKLRTVDGVL